ncbi:hypothetical protein BDZ89DRAFT_1072454, partial [Hymenopellis radicata]
MAMRCGDSFPDSTATDIKCIGRSSHSYKLNDTFTRLESTQPTLGIPVCVGPSETTNSHRTLQPPFRSPYSSTPRE